MLALAGFSDVVLHALRNAAGAYGVAPELLIALAWKESGGNPWAYNPEPKYQWLWNVRTGQPFRPLQAYEKASEVPPIDFPTRRGDRDQEWWAQQASWGLCQVMGAVAREHGFTGDYLTELNEPNVGAAYGAKVLAKLLIRFKADESEALSAYNAGAPTDANVATYVRPILAKREELRRSGL